MGRHFKFSAWKLIATVTGMAILIGLGVWQLERLQWKTALIEMRAAHQKLPVLDSLPKDIDYKPLNFRRAHLIGLIEESKTIFLGPRTSNGKAGYHMLVPMTLGDGRSILVDKGFIPSEYVKRTFKPGHIEILSGTLVEPPLPGPFTPVNPPVYDKLDGDKFYWVDLLAIGNAIGAQRLVPLVLESDKMGDGYPIGGQGMQDLPNDHLQYALFWFTMALILFVIYILSSFRGAVERNKLHLRKSSDSNTQYPNLWG